VNQPANWPATVTTTLQPDVPLQVDEIEWTDLNRQGLLADDGTTEPARVRAARDVKGA
jgi:hypothetical protein